MCQNVSKIVLLTWPKFQANISSCSRIPVHGERQKHTLPPRTKDSATEHIISMSLDTRKSSLGLNSHCAVKFGLLWHCETLFQNATGNTRFPVINTTPVSNTWLKLAKNQAKRKATMTYLFGLRNLLILI